VEDVAEIDRETCLGCGVCVGQCPEDAIQLVREKSKGEPMDVQKLANQ
jgi:Pyruvate/2-oxoacid:ferredoxin oxidoreductase delta subunit